MIINYLKQAIDNAVMDSSILNFLIFSSRLIWESPIVFSIFFHERVPWIFKITFISPITPCIPVCENSIIYIFFEFIHPKCEIFIRIISNYQIIHKFIHFFFTCIVRIWFKLFSSCAIQIFCNYINWNSTPSSLIYI